jgi:ABC-2 type transport system permease protein
MSILQSLPLSLRRIVATARLELRQNRIGFLYAPMVLAGLLFFMLITAHLSGGQMKTSNREILPRMLAQAVQEPEFKEKASVAFEGMFAALTVPFHLTLSIVLVVFFLGAIFDERKDRSILFWKSLPVSDTQSVLGKLLLALVVAPAVTALVAGLTHVAVLLYATVWLKGAGLKDAGFIWTASAPWVAPFKFLLLAWANMLWILPIYAWCLFCSAWTRMRPLLIAVLVPGLVYIAASWVKWIAGVSLGVDRFISFFVERFPGLVYPFGINTTSRGPVGGDPYKVLGSTDLWLGLALGLALIVGAIYLRKRNDEAL